MFLATHHVQLKGFLVDEEVRLLDEWSRPNLNINEPLWQELKEQVLRRKPISKYFGITAKMNVKIFNEKIWTSCHLMPSRTKAIFEPKAKTLTPDFDILYFLFYLRDVIWRSRLWSSIFAWPFHRFATFKLLCHQPYILRI